MKTTTTKHIKSILKSFLIILIILFTFPILIAQDIIDPNKNIQIRWEKKGELLLVTVTDQPKDKPMIIIQSLSTIEKPLYAITNVILSDYSGDLHWIHNSDGLEVTVPLKILKEKSFKLKVSIKRKPNFLPNYLYRNSRFLEGVPVPEYQWASEEAYEAFNDLKYGIRIHWGLYSALGVEASWPYLEMTNEERMKYSDRYKIFNPKSFDADKWMSFFIENGMKMVAFVTKHHDGFSLFDTKTVVKNRINWAAKDGPKVEPYGLSYDIMDSPFKRDIVKEICESARKHNIKIDLYFSNIDWFDADQRGLVGSGYDLGNLSVASDEELKRGMQRHRDQLKELISNYGKIDMICLDMSLKERAWLEARQTMLELRKLQPDVMYRNRNIDNYGDYYTPEGWVPSNVEATNMPWFVIYTLSGIFAYDPLAENYRDGGWIVNNVIDATAKGGSFMVSIGPDENGLFHPKAIEAVESAGDWFRINGEAIFATRPWKTFGEGPTATALLSANKRTLISYTAEDIRFTRSKDHQTIYAILMGVPSSKSEILIKSLSKKSEPSIEIKKITVIGNVGELKWSRDDKALKVEMPDKQPCNYAYAIKIKLK